MPGRASGARVEEQRRYLESIRIHGNLDTLV
jgi:hypothetical protein